MSGNSREFPRILWRRKLFQEFKGILDIYPVPENSWKLFRMVLESENLSLFVLGKYPIL